MRHFVSLTSAMLALAIPAAAQSFPAGGIGAHVADGGGWSTSLMLSNFSAGANSVRVLFFSNNGTPMQVRLVMDGGDAIVTNERVVELNPYSTVRLRTAGSGSDVQTGWMSVAGVGANKPVTGTVVFRQSAAGRPDYEAAVPLAYGSKNSFLIQFDNSDSYVSGIAMANSSASSSSVLIDAWDENGTQLAASESVPLNGMNQTAMVLADRFRGLAGKRGYMWVRTNTPGLSIFGLRFNPGGAFTTLNAWSN